MRDFIAGGLPDTVNDIVSYNDLTDANFWFTSYDDFTSYYEEIYYSSRATELGMVFEQVKAIASERKDCHNALLQYIFSHFETIRLRVSATLPANTRDTVFSPILNEAFITWLCDKDNLNKFRVASNVTVHQPTPSEVSNAFTQMSLLPGVNVRDVEYLEMGAKVFESGLVAQPTTEL